VIQLLLLDFDENQRQEVPSGLDENPFFLLVASQ